MTDPIIINVGGTLFETKSTTLNKYPSTLLGSLNLSSEYYVPEKQFYFFDRNPDLFNTVLDYYRNGHVHFPTHICGLIWKQEMEFWQLPINEISECCLPVYMKYGRDKELENRLKEAFKIHSIENGTSNSNINIIRQRVWLFLEEPNSSLPARIYSIFYLIIVLLSVALVMVANYHDAREETFDIDLVVWWFKFNNFPIWFDVNNPKMVMYVTSKTPTWIQRFDQIITVFFTIDILLRFLCCPNKLAFLKNLLNILDIVLLFAMWIHFIIEVGYQEQLLKNKNVINLFSVCYSLLALRLLRFFRITKQYSSLRVLFLAVRESVHELFLLLITFVIFVVLFANLIFFAEQNEPTTFPDILIGMWWAIVTMTTVGYGDQVPRSVLGRIVGSACALCGLLLLAMPIAVIAGKFNELYDKNKDREDFNKLQKSTGKCKKLSAVVPITVN